MFFRPIKARTFALSQWFAVASPAFANDPGCGTNGVEVFRSSMPTATVTYLTQVASSALAIDETTNLYSTNVSAALLRDGTNLLAV